MQFPGIAGLSNEKLRIFSSKFHPTEFHPGLVGDPLFRRTFPLPSNTGQCPCDDLTWISPSSVIPGPARSSKDWVQLTSPVYNDFPLRPKSSEPFPDPCIHPSLWDWSPVHKLRDPPPISRLWQRGCGQLKVAAVAPPEVGRTAEAPTKKLYAHPCLQCSNCRLQPFSKPSSMPPHPNHLRRAETPMGLLMPSQELQ